LGEIELEINQLKSALLSVNFDQIISIFSQLGQKYSEYLIVDLIISPTLNIIGNLWQTGKISLAEMYMSAKICDSFLIENFNVQSINKNQFSTKKMAIVCLEDYHGLGKKIIYMMLRNNGYILSDYGIGIKVDELVKKVIQDKIEIILISTLMYHSALKIKEFKEKIFKSGYTNLKIIVGGAPFNFHHKLYKFVGADAYGYSIDEIIQIINKYSGVLS
jgi:trimethylamine corrinoid protein